MHGVSDRQGCVCSQGSGRDPSHPEESMDLVIMDRLLLLAKVGGRAVLGSQL